MEFLKNKELNHTECLVLAMYKYYTENGEYKCSSKTKPQIAEELGISPRYMKKIKRHLTELGLIKSSGIKVFYVGIKGDTIVPTNNEQGDTIGTTGGHQSDQGGHYRDPQRDTIVSTKGTPECPHKKEKEKEYKKEEKRGFGNFEQLLGKLPEEYKTPERIDFIKENFMDKLNEADLNDGIIDTWVTGIKMELNKHFPIEFVIEKPEPRSDTIDLF